MTAKKKAAKKVEKPKVRIKKGSFSCSYDSVSMVLESLIRMGFKLEDLKHTSIELSWDGCYYPDDNPSINVVWGDIL